MPDSRRVRPISLALVILLVGGMTLVPFPVSPMSPARAAGTASDATLSIAAVGDYGYQPDLLEQQPTNTTISVTFTDKSPMAHTFTVLNREGWVVPTSYTTSQIDALVFGRSASVMFNLNVTQTGMQNTSSFGSPGPGWYEFICTVSGHFQLGMYGFIAFGMNLPSNLTPVNRTGLGGALSFGPVEAAVLGGVVIVLLVGAIYWVRWRETKRRRS